MILRERTTAKWISYWRYGTTDSSSANHKYWRKSYRGTLRIEDVPRGLIRSYRFNRMQARSSNPALRTVARSYISHQGKRGRRKNPMFPRSEILNIWDVLRSRPKLLSE